MSQRLMIEPAGGGGHAGATTIVTRAAQPPERPPALGRLTILQGSAPRPAQPDGFGGSVAALRAAEKGYAVGVLEAGRRFGATTIVTRAAQPPERRPALGRLTILQGSAPRPAQPDPGITRGRIHSVDPALRDS